MTYTVNVRVVVAVRTLLATDALAYTWRATCGMYTLFTWVALWNACCMVGLHAGHAKAVRISQGIGCSGSSRRSGSSPRRIGFICVFGPRRRTGNSGDRVTAVQPPDVDNEGGVEVGEREPRVPRHEAACSSRLPVAGSRVGVWSVRVRRGGPVKRSGSDF